MKLVPTMGWKLVGNRDEAVDLRLMPLLEAIASGTSLAAAVSECGVSYRAAWGLLREYGRKIGAPLVLLERGRGARLTALGEVILRGQTTAAQRLARVFPELAVDLGGAVRPASRIGATRLRVAASHDLALAALPEILSQTVVTLEISVMGSLNALRAFAEGRADVAGFHIEIGRPAKVDRAPFLRWLRARRDTLVQFADRDQGLILPRGNPSRVRSLRDIADRNLRFVNRQHGSGTRLLIDRIIVDEEIDAVALGRFGVEELTHPAVAATVASGGADAGFGLRAAAAEYGLVFVPVVRERYFLAVRTKDIGKPPIAPLIEALRSRAFARHVRRFPGYRAPAPGLISGVETLG